MSLALPSKQCIGWAQGSQWIPSRPASPLETAQATWTLRTLVLCFDWKWLLWRLLDSRHWKAVLSKHQAETAGTFPTALHETRCWHPEARTIECLKLCRPFHHELVYTWSHRVWNIRYICTLRWSYKKNGGHTLSMTAIFWPFLTPSPLSDCKMMPFY